MINWSTEFGPASSGGVYSPPRVLLPTWLEIKPAPLPYGPVPTRQPSPVAPLSPGTFGKYGEQPANHTGRPYPSPSPSFSSLTAGEQPVDHAVPSVRPSRLLSLAIGEQPADHTVP